MHGLLLALLRQARALPVLSLMGLQLLWALRALVKQVLSRQLPRAPSSNLWHQGLAVHYRQQPASCVLSRASRTASRRISSAASRGPDGPSIQSAQGSSADRSIAAQSTVLCMSRPQLEEEQLECGVIFVGLQDPCG